ncbi:reverse transcriptase domain-containing protein [Tanacetum coccineum]
MVVEDEYKTAFFAGEGIYCYRKMPFGLKNAGESYQRLVDKVFNEQIGRNIEAYVDDMVIKSTSEEDMLTDIKETFQRDFTNAQSTNTWGSSNDVSRSFARREEGHVPIYFVSRVLQGAELNYPTLEKLILALALTKPKKSGRIAKWAIELGEHDIVFRAKGDSNKETPKDILIEAPLKDNRKEVGRNTDTKLEETKPSCEWKLYTDGASSSDGLGAGLMLIDPKGKEYTHALRFEFETTNNEAEYKALLAGLRIA